MVRGFYTLASGMITQERILSTISNNLSNVETTGYKKQQVTTTTFGEMVMARIGSEITPLGTVSSIQIADETNTIHSQGTLENTNRNLDFAISNEGFFAVQSDNGLVYTRNGNFSIDEEGYLTLGNVGRVVGENGPIQLGTDSFTTDNYGGLYVNDQLVDSIAVYNFEDYNTLKISGEGMYTATQNAVLMDSPTVLWKTLEGSNVDTGEEMTNAISSQRQLQSCSQALQMYDETLNKAVTDIGRL